MACNQVYDQILLFGVKPDRTITRNAAVTYIDFAL